MRSASLLLVMLTGCTQLNPLYGRGDEEGSSGAQATASTTSDAGDSSSGSVDSVSGGGVTTADASTSDGHDSSVDPSGAATSSSTTGDQDVDAPTSTSTTGGWGSSSSSTGAGPLQEVDLGQGCEINDECVALHPDAVCCEQAQCLNTCMVPCTSPDECPFAGMDCQHDHCLFPCDNSDADCLDWPGYTCQHGGVLCENDVM